MACSITNVQVIAVGPPGGSSSSITISGNASECTQIKLSFNCGGAPFVTTLTPDANGNWTVTTGSPVCACSKEYTLVIECVENPKCQFRQTAVLNCSEPEGCPVVVSYTISQATDCNPDGTRTVTFTITISNGSGSQAVVALEFESNIYGAPVVINAGATQVLNQSFNYPPGTYTAYLTFSEPPGCSPVPFPITVQPCAPACLDQNEITASISPTCNVDGTRNVTFTWPFVVPQITIDFGDNSPTITISGNSITKGYLPPGPYTASFQIPNCPQIKVTVGPLGACESHIAGACCLPDKSCIIATQADCMQQGGTYQGDNTTCASANCNPNQGSGGSGCGAFTYIIAGLLVVAMVTTLIVLCLQFCLGITVPPWLWGVLIGLWAADAVAVALWYILCHIIHGCPCPKKCDWLAIAWVPTLAGAIIALYLSGCCSLMLWIAIGLFAEALAAFAIWYKECKPTKCQLVAMLSLAIVTGVVTGFTYITLLPGISACGLNYVKVAAGTLALALAALTAACAADN